MYRLTIVFLLTGWLTTGLQAQSRVKFPFIEPFDAAQAVWNMKANQSVRVEKGHLIVSPPAMQSLTFMVDPDITADRDVAIHARMIFTDGLQSAYAGIRFLCNGRTYADFLINNQRSFVISTFDRKDEQLRASVSQVIKPFDYNTLTVVKTGNNFRFLINDKQVFETKIKGLEGSQAGFTVAKGLAVAVDEFQIHDPKKGREKLPPGDLNGEATDATAGLNDLLQVTDRPEDYGTFFKTFTSYQLPLELGQLVDKAVDVSRLPFTRKTFFAFDGDRLRYHNILALALLAVCPDTDALLVASMYGLQEQDIIRYSVEFFDKKGNKLDSKEIGSRVVQSGSLWKTVDFDITQNGQSVFIDATESFQNGNKTKNSVAFHRGNCNR